MADKEVFLFFEIFHYDNSDDNLKKLLNELKKELIDVESVSELGGYVKECRKHRTVKEFRDCIIAKIENARKLRIANALNLKEEQEKRIVAPTPEVTNRPSRR